MKIKHLLLIICLSSLNLSIANTPWELEKNSKGIKIYTRSVNTGGVKEFKAITTVSADIIKIANLITNVTNYINWYPDIIESTILKRLSKKERIVYYKMDVPWPVYDRDAVLKLSVKITKEGQDILISMNSISGYKNKVKKVERIDDAIGFWRLTTQGNKTKVVYQFLGNPGGSMPAWMVNMLIVESPYNTLVALKKKVEKN
jgi:hypothetical protein